MPTSAAPATDPDSGDPVYAYKPSLVGGPFEFRLTADALEWRKDGRVGRASYDRIRRIRLSFRPATAQNHRFLAEIWPENGSRLKISSASWRSMMEQERLDASYTAFLIELNRRVGAAGGRSLLQTGSPPLLYWLGFLMSIAALLALAALIVRALQVQAWGGAAFIAAVLALFLWQTVNFFRRNRPGLYRADAIPAEVLPNV